MMQKIHTTAYLEASRGIVVFVFYVDISANGVGEAFIPDQLGWPNVTPDNWPGAENLGQRYWIFLRIC